MESTIVENFGYEKTKVKGTMKMFQTQQSFQVSTLTCVKDLSSSNLKNAICWAGIKLDLYANLRNKWSLVESSIFVEWKIWAVDKESIRRNLITPVEN